ncbi:MAG: hypothetical protein AB7O69_07805 [Burkholderiales bacterium]
MLRNETNWWPSTYQPHLQRIRARVMAAFAACLPVVAMMRQLFDNVNQAIQMLACASMRGAEAPFYWDATA